MLINFPLRRNVGGWRPSCTWFDGRQQRVWRSPNNDYNNVKFFVIENNR